MINHSIVGSSVELMEHHRISLLIAETPSSP